MASMYAQYLAEKTKDYILETEYGYATYRFLNEGKSVYIIDIFVLPEHRRQGYALNMIEEIIEIAKKAGCTESLGTIMPSSPGSTASMKMHMAAGAELLSASNDVIVLRKDI